jgi:hypothetical protein
MLTGSNGEPDAKITLPFVHSYACAAVHSALRGGRRQILCQKWQSQAMGQTKREYAMVHVENNQ